MDYKASLCAGCGLPRHETMDPAAAESMGVDPRYHAEPMVCHACAAREHKARNDAQGEGGMLPGVFYAIVDDRE